MKKKILLISVLFIGILSLSTLEVKAFVSKCDQGLEDKLIDDDNPGIAGKESYDGVVIERLYGDDETYKNKVYKGSRAVFYNEQLYSADLTVSQYQLVDEVRRDEPVYFNIGYYAKGLKKPIVQIRCGNANEHKVRIEDIASIKLLDIMSDTNAIDGYVNLWLKITPHATTEELLEAGLDNMWFRVDFLDYYGDSDSLHFAVIGLRNVKPAKRETHESDEVLKTKGKYLYWYKLFSEMNYGKGKEVAQILWSDKEEHGGINIDKLSWEKQGEIISFLERARYDSNFGYGWFSVYGSELVEYLKGVRNLKKEKEKMEEDGTPITSEEADYLKNKLDEIDKETSESVQNRLDQIKEVYKAEFTPIEDERKSHVFYNVFDSIDFYVDSIGNISGKDNIKLANKVSVILTIITNVGMILAVLMSAFMGVKYMLGSVEEKADYKKDMIPYLVGSILLFGICSTVKLLYIIGSNINNM